MKGNSKNATKKKLKKQAKTNKNKLIRIEFALKKKNDN